MNKIYDVVRLILTKSMSNADIAAALVVSRTTVRRYRKLIEENNYTWEQLSALKLHELDAVFNKTAGNLTTKRLPLFAEIQKELQIKGVTLQLLWQDYRAESPDDALAYAHFTHLYRAYLKATNVVMRQHYRPGQYAFVDYSGKRPWYFDQASQRQVFVELFVGVLGASHLIFTLCTATQQVHDWIEANVRMLEYFGGVPEIIVPDNLKSAIVRPGRQPLVQRIYLDFGRHYNVAIVPARPRRPQDKAKVEVGVQIVQRWVLARIRHRTFFSLSELNVAVLELVGELNRRPFKRFDGCRQSRFEELERPALQALRSERFEYAQWCSGQKVPNDYHVQVAGHFYSVPHTLVGKTVEARTTGTAVEIYCQQERVAAHVRHSEGGAHTTSPEHQPIAHRSYAERTPELTVSWAERIGPSTTIVVKHQFDRSLPMLGMPACDALRRLAQQYGAELLEMAATRAIEIKSLTASSVKSLLRTGRHRNNEPIPPVAPIPEHINVRGADYYGAEGEPC